MRQSIFDMRRSPLKTDSYQVLAQRGPTRSRCTSLLKRPEPLSNQLRKPTRIDLVPNNMRLFAAPVGASTQPLTAQRMAQLGGGGGGGRGTEASSAEAQVAVVLARSVVGACAETAINTVGTLHLILYNST